MVIHGSITHAGKVRRITPKVPKKEGKKQLVGRGGLRKRYNRRILGVAADGRRQLGPNSHAQ
jgi:ribosomal protein S30